jgi:hypothetical protein
VPQKVLSEDPVAEEIWKGDLLLGDVIMADYLAKVRN